MRNDPVPAGMISMRGFVAAAGAHALSRASTDKIRRFLADHGFPPDYISTGGKRGHHFHSTERIPDLAKVVDELRRIEDEAKEQERLRQEARIAAMAEQNPPRDDFQMMVMMCLTDLQNSMKDLRSRQADILHAQVEVRGLLHAIVKNGTQQ